MFPDQGRLGCIPTVFPRALSCGFPLASKFPSRLREGCIPTVFT